jgi:hypothetical protein
MTTGTIKTQGTELYVINPLNTDPELLKFACPTGISGIGGAADQLEDTCLDNTTEKTYKRGLGNPGAVSVPFNFVPRDLSHQMALMDFLRDGREFSWLALLSESTAAPTLDTDGAFVRPATRTSFSFTAYIADVNIDVATNEIVRGTLTLQRSGQVDWQFYTPA